MLIFKVLTLEISELDLTCIREVYTAWDEESVKYSRKEKLSESSCKQGHVSAG